MLKKILLILISIVLFITFSSGNAETQKIKVIKKDTATKKQADKDKDIVETADEDYDNPAYY